MQLDRMDFVINGIRCHTCKSTLTKGFIGRLSDGSEVAFGPTCAIKQFGNAIKDCPDLTNGVLTPPTGISGGTGGGGTSGGTKASRAAFAYRYLLLRLHSLPTAGSQSKKLAHPALSQYLSQYRNTGSLPTGIVDQIIDMEALEVSLLKAKNLLDVYSAQHDLNQKILSCDKNTTAGSQQATYLDAVKISLLKALNMNKNLAATLNLSVKADAFS